MTSPYRQLVLVLVTIIVSVYSVDPIEEDVKIKVWDASCKHTYRNLYEFGYNFDEISKTSLLNNDYRLESYVGYPCNVGLWGEYLKSFVGPKLRCPFEGNLDKLFQEFIWMKLWTHTQTIPVNKTDAIPSNNSLLFQYICFSKQYEICEPDANIKQKGGSCDGVCKCMDSVPLEPFGYPVGLTPKDNLPAQMIEDKIHCGVKASGLCIPSWNRQCNKNNPNYNVTLENKFNPKDFYFKCESNAGCHAQKKVCECSQGHSCVPSKGTLQTVSGFLSAGIHQMIVLLIVYFFTV